MCQTCADAIHVVTKKKVAHLKAKLGLWANVLNTGFPFYRTQVGIASTRWGLGCARLVGTPEVLVFCNILGSMVDPNLDSFQPQIMYALIPGMVCTMFSTRSRLPAPHNSQPVPNNLRTLQQYRSTAIQRGGQLLACEI